MSNVINSGNKTPAKKKREAPAHAFKPGQSGNPLGRKKLPDDIKLAFSELSDIAIEKLRAILDGSMEDVRTADVIRACEIVLDRHLGKPLQQVQATITRPIVFDDIYTTRDNVNQ